MLLFTSAVHAASPVRASTSCRAAMPSSYYRKDGVKITHDPHAPGMAAKYGAPGKTDADGFDPYADSVGAGIYSGTVQRAADGSVVIGRQYQGHNPRPGPVYSGGGYTPVSEAISRPHSEMRSGAAEADTTLAKLLDAHPDLVNDVATGGASPLHTCGMSRSNQHAAAFLIARGADVAATDTYGYTPLDRMASNNLAVGADALLASGAEPDAHGPPFDVAMDAEAKDVLAVLEKYEERVVDKPVTKIVVYSKSSQRWRGRTCADPRPKFRRDSGTCAWIMGGTRMPRGGSSTAAARTARGSRRTPTRATSTSTERTKCGG